MLHMLALLTVAVQGVCRLHRQLPCARLKWILVSTAIAFTVCIVFLHALIQCLTSRALADAIIALDAVNPIVASSVAGRFSVVSCLAVVSLSCVCAVFLITDCWY